MCSSAWGLAADNVEQYTRGQVNTQKKLAHDCAGILLFDCLLSLIQARTFIAGITSTDFTCSWSSAVILYMAFSQSAAGAYERSLNFLVKTYHVLHNCLRFFTVGQAKCHLKAWLLMHHRRYAANYLCCKGSICLESSKMSSNKTALIYNVGEL